MIDADNPTHPHCKTLGDIDGDGNDNHDVELADVDEDGDLDAVSREGGGGSTYFWRQVSPTIFDQITLTTRNGEGMSLGDLDGDDDIGVAQNGFWIEQVNPTTWVEHEIDEDWPNDVGVLITDLDGNGKADVVLGASEDPNEPLSWYEAADPVAGP